MASKNDLNTKQLKAGFNVGHMTIYNWRHGTPTKDPLPHEARDNGQVVFSLPKVKAWAKKHNLDFIEPTTPAEWKKPGPRKVDEKPTALDLVAKVLVAKAKTKKDKPEPKATPVAKKATVKAKAKAVIEKAKKSAAKKTVPPKPVEEVKQPEAQVAS